MPSAAGPSKAIVVHPRFRHTLPAPSSVRFTDLSNDALHLIAKSLASKAQDLLRFEAVSKACRRAANDEMFWRELCKSKFAVPDDAQPPSWRALYRFNHEFLYKVILSYATDRLMQQRLGGLAHGAAFNIPVLA